MTSRSRTIRRLAAMFVLALIASGCLRFEVGTTVQADESGQLVIASLFGPEYQAIAEEFGGVDSSGFDDAMPASAELSDIVDGDFVGRQAVIPFTSLAQLAGFVDEVLVIDGGGELAFFASFAVTRNGSAFAFDADSAAFENESSGELDDDIDIEFTIVVSIELPGVVTDHNADEVDGNVLTWRFPGEESRSLTARSQTELVGGFTDVAGNTHADAIVWVAEQGITTGFPDGTFRPNGDVTRGQMATFLARALDLSPGTAAFSDVAGNVHAPGISAVAEAQITTGFPDGTFRPNDDVTRGQMATFLARALDLPAGTATFSDIEGNVHADAIAAVAAADITTGFADGTFRPGDPVTRGQMATFLFRALAGA